MALNHIEASASEARRSTTRRVVIDVRDLRFSYAGADDAAPTLGGIDLAVSDCEIVCLVGASGCGKSTLLNLVAGFLEPTGGDVLLDGRPVVEPGTDRVMVFQEDAVFPWYTVRRNVEYGLRLRGVGRGERDERVDALLDLVGLRHVADSFPRELSGGMRKRCDMARALALDPRVLLMDEPFAALDVMTKEHMQTQFLKLWERHRMTVLFVTHDLEEALVLGDRVVVMRPGGEPPRLVLDVPFARPRDVSLKEHPDFQSLRVELAHAIRGLDSEEAADVR